jgi:tRNA-specific 2-thiouridylase
MKKKMKVAAAMSGGVDSAVAAALLKEAGHEVVGIFMENWTEDVGGCDADRDREDALAAAMKLGIPFRVFNFEKEYRQEVIDYFYREYAAGRTPNPDVECNRVIKFGLFLETARREEGVDKIATGHYARVERGKGKVWRLLKGVDETKDQSYFLWTLGQEELGRSLFPVGGMTKREVRAKARRLGLGVADKPDSQGICFVGEVDVGKFLRRRLPEKKGKIVDQRGRVLGGHPGAWFYTVGQRRGLGIGGGIPYYVTGTDVEKNVVRVAPINDPALYAEEAIISGVNWISGAAPEMPLKCRVKIRYRQPEVEVVVREKGKKMLVARFAEEQRAVTPGQSAVFYRGDEVLGGGVIVKTC